MEFEIGTDDLPAFYAERQGKADQLRVSRQDIKARMTVIQHGGTLLPLDNTGHAVATEVQIAEIRQQLDREEDRNAKSKRHESEPT